MPKIPKPAGLARLKTRHKLAMLSFAGFVGLPVLLMTAYLYIFAADQYASTVGFTVRTEESGSAMEILGGLTKLSTASSSDTDILYKFIQSQELVLAMDESLDLHKLYGKPRFDPVFRLSENASIEETVSYWKKMVRIYYDPGIGLMEIEVRAFDPADAKAIAVDIFARSTARINELSAIARADTMRYARDELDTAVERLKEARQALTLFRNETQIVDPSADIQGQMGLLTSLNTQLATALIELDILIETTRETDPRMEQTRRKIAVIERRIADEREKLGVGQGRDGKAYADLVGTFESLQVDLNFAEKAYISALSAYDTAVAEARRQSRYLAAYVEPTLAQTPLYPQRMVIILVGGFVIFGLWSICLLIYYSLHDRR
ncbi:sugar transporter [Tabrizicola fusiformis]|uniref:sugar transporter n=1 Tax=Tabrizicola sp. SY72 TaxID=2741673 RepID=UPI0032206CBB